MISRRHLLAAAAAAVAASPFAASAQADDPAIARIQAFYDSLQAALSGPAAADPKQRMAVLSEAMMRTFDFPTMIRLAVGPQWSKLPADKQASLTEAFGAFFVANYARGLGQMAGGRLEVMPKTDQRAGGRLVRTQVVDAAGKATPVDYLVNKDERVVDVYLNGTISEVASRRAEFEGALKAGGADALEANLRKRASQLMGGA